MEGHVRVFGRSPIRCLCCGAVERMAGCFVGLPCQCPTLFEDPCFRCRRCRVHCSCPGGPVSWERRRAEVLSASGRSGPGAMREKGGG